MSLFPDLTPIVNQLKEFTQSQQQTNLLLQSQNQLLQEIKEILKNN